MQYDTVTVIGCYILTIMNNLKFLRVTPTGNYCAIISICDNSIATLRNSNTFRALPCAIQLAKTSLWPCNTTSTYTRVYEKKKLSLLLIKFIAIQAIVLQRA